MDSTDSDIEDSRDEHTERKKALRALYKIQMPPKISILEREPDEEELMAIRIIQKFYRGYHIRKHMKKLKLARCREIVVRNKSGMKTYPYGFVLKNRYEQSFRLTNIVDVTYNSKMGQILIMDTRGVSCWKKSEREKAVSRPYLFEKYQSRYLRCFTYSQKMNVYYAISKDYAIKVINKDFEETHEVNAAEARAISIVLNEKNDEIWAVGPDGVKIWVLVQRPELNWNSVKSMVNYWLQKKADMPNVAGGWTLTAFFDLSGEIFFACSETAIVMYNLDGEEICRVNQCHLALITGVDRSDKCECVISCSHDSTVKVWKHVQRNIKHIHTFYCGKKLTALAVHPKDAGMALVCSEDGFIKILSLECLTELNRIYVSESPVNRITFTPDKHLIVATARNVYFYDLNYHYKFWATTRTPVIGLELLEADGKTTRVQAIGTDSSVRLISHHGTYNYSTILPPPNVPATKRIIGVTCLREFNLIYVLLDEQIVWVYTVRTHPACHIDAWNMARHQEQLITELLDGYHSETFIRFPTAEDLTHPVVENAYGVISVVQCTTIACLNSKIRFFRRNVGYMYTESNLFVLIGLEDGRILFMDPLTSSKKHVDFRPNKHPIGMIRYFKEQELLTALSVDKQSQAFISIWKLPDVEMMKEIATTNDCINYSLVARSVLSGHQSGVLNIHVWNTVKGKRNEKQTQARNRFIKAVKKVMAISSFTKLSDADLEPDSDDEYVDLEKGQTKRKNTEHLGKVLNIECNNYLQVFLSVGEIDHTIKIWSKSKTQLREICLDASLSSACFITDLGDIVFSYSSHLFFMSRHFLFPELKNIREEFEVVKDVESYVHEHSELRFGAVATHHKQPETLESYLIPFNLQENFYQSKESIIKWDQDGQRRVRYDDDDYSESTETTFDSLRADSETYASIGSFAENRYSHWDFIKPSMNVLIDDDDDEEDDLSTISGRSSRSDVMSHLQLPASFNPYTPHVTTSDPLFKKMSVGAKFKLPRMVSTPTPLSPILKEEGVKEEQMDEQKMVQMSPDNGDGDDVPDDTDAAVTLEEDLKDEAKSPSPIIAAASPSPKRLSLTLSMPPASAARTPISPVSRRSSKSNVVTPTPQAASPASRPPVPVAPVIRKRSAPRQGRVGAMGRRQPQNTSETELLTVLSFPQAKESLLAVAPKPREVAETIIKRLNKSASKQTPIETKAIDIPTFERPPLPSLENLGAIEIKSTDVNEQSVNSKTTKEDTVYSTHVIEKRKSMCDSTSYDTTKVSHGETIIDRQQFPTDTADSETIKVVVSSKSKPSSSPAEYSELETSQYGDTVSYKDTTMQTYPEHRGTEKRFQFATSEISRNYDKASLAAEQNMKWVEKQLFSHEMKKRVKEQRIQAVRNKQLEDMFKLWYKRQQFENRQSTSVDAFFKILATDFINHVVSRGQEIDENSLPEALKEMLRVKIHEQNQLKQASEGESKLQKEVRDPNSRESKDSRTNMGGYRVPAMVQYERFFKPSSQLGQPRNELEDSSLFVDMSEAALLLAAESRRNSLVDVERTASAMADCRPVSRLCKSANASTKVNYNDHLVNYDTDRPVSSFGPMKPHHKTSKSSKIQFSHYKASEANIPNRTSSAKSIPSKCTEYILVRTVPDTNSLFTPPSNTEKHLLSKRFPNIYQQAVGLRQGVYSAPKK